MTNRILLDDPPKRNGHATRLLPFIFQQRTKSSVTNRRAEYGIGPDEPIEQPDAKPAAPESNIPPKHLQEPLLAILLYDKVNGERVRSLIPVKAYNGPYRLFAAKAVAYWDQFREPPGQHVFDICEELQTADPKQADTIRSVYDSLQDTRQKLNAAYVLSRVDEYLQDHAFREGVLAAVDLLEQGRLVDAQALMRNVSEGKGFGSIDFSPMTLGELMTADVAVEYLIESLLVAKQPILMAGPVKSLKTSLLLALCLALTTGKYFLGKFNVLRKIKVAVLSGESGLPVIKDTLLRIARSMGIDPAKVDNLIISDRVPQLSNPAHLDAIRRLIIDQKLELLAIDPAYLALDGTDAANVMVFGQQLRAVSELCQELGVALLLCHHTKKGTATSYDPIGLTDAAWAGFAEHARQWLLVNHRERYDPDTGIHRLWLSVGGSAGHSGLYALDVDQGRFDDPNGRRWVVSVNTATDAKDKAADRRVEQRQGDDMWKVEKAMAALEVEHPDGNSRSAIRSRAGLNVARFDAAIQAVLDQERAVSCTFNRSNWKKAQAGFRLVEEGKV